MSAANALRGEAELRVGDTVHVLRPSFAALVAAEEELGPLFALVERAADGRLALGEMAALFWHCVRDRPSTLTRTAIGEAWRVELSPAVAGVGPWECTAPALAIDAAKMATLPPGQTVEIRQIGDFALSPPLSLSLT
ncbi:MAG: gene transfer agent family protein [Sphingopyxis sp.]|nr:gene transfer agent family protein [Sphingopyxis sp.]